MSTFDMYPILQHFFSILDKCQTVGHVATFLPIFATKARGEERGRPYRAVVAPPPEEQGESGHASTPPRASRGAWRSAAAPRRRHLACRGAEGQRPCHAAANTSPNRRQRSREERDRALPEPKSERSHSEQGESGRVLPL